MGGRESGGRSHILLYAFSVKKTKIVNRGSYIEKSSTSYIEDRTSNIGKRCTKFEARAVASGEIQLCVEK